MFMIASIKVRLNRRSGEPVEIDRDRRRAIANGDAKVGDNTDVHHQDSKNMTKPVVINRSKNRAKH